MNLNSSDNLAETPESAKCGIWFWDQEASQVVFEVSWRKLFQYREDEKIAWADILHPDDFLKVISKILSLSSGETAEYHSKHRVLNGRGEWCWVQETAEISRKDEQNYAQAVKVTSHLIDVDEMIVNEKNEQSVIQNKMSQAMKMESIGHLTAGIAHDFNNLLAGMLGYAELSMEMIDEGGDVKEIKEYLKQIMLAGCRAKELVSQMLTYSRINPADEDEPAVCVLKPILSEVVQLARSSIPSSIDVNYRVMDDNVKVKLHPVNLHQVLLNMVINSRDAIKEFGKIEISQTVSTNEFVCSACKEKLSGEYIEISVHDTGHGIPVEIQDKIFDSFFTTKDIGKGTGMGLAVAQGLVHRLNGHITVDSRKGVGTTVRIYLPAVTEHENNELAPVGGNEEESELCLKGIRILVIDDEVTITNLLTELLTMYGAEVSAYNRPDKALSEFIRNPNKYGVVITDSTMPEISGIELSRAILQLRPNMPIMICTGYSNMVDEEFALSNGISGFMKKPLEIPRLLEWIGLRAN